MGVSSSSISDTYQVSNNFISNNYSINNNSSNTVEKVNITITSETIDGASIEAVMKAVTNQSSNISVTESEYVKMMNSMSSSQKDAFNVGISAKNETDYASFNTYIQQNNMDMCTNHMDTKQITNLNLVAENIKNFHTKIVLTQNNSANCIVASVQQAVLTGASKMDNKQSDSLFGSWGLIIIIIIIAVVGYVAYKMFFSSGSGSGGVPPEAMLL